VATDVKTDMEDLSEWCECRTSLHSGNPSISHDTDSVASNVALELNLMSV
jgi:hypothetical protein